MKRLKDSNSQGPKFRRAACVRSWGLRELVPLGLLLWAFPLLAAPAAGTLNTQIWDTTGTAGWRANQFPVAGNNGKVLGISAGAWGLVNSAGSWGGISGTLTDQTDLTTALGLKAPLANAAFTGTFSAPNATITNAMLAGSIDLATKVTGTLATARLDASSGVGSAADSGKVVKFDTNGSIMVADLSASGSATLGTSGDIAGILQFNDGTSAFAATISLDGLTDNRGWTLPDDDDGNLYFASRGWVTTTVMADYAPINNAVHTGTFEVPLTFNIGDDGYQLRGDTEPGIAQLPLGGGSLATYEELANLYQPLDADLTSLASNGPRDFYPEDYGTAIPGDGIDDLPALQAACNAAAAVTGGRVRLKAGVYQITVVYDSTTTFVGGTKADGHYGLEIPSGVEVYGAGSLVTILEGVVGTSNGDTGTIVSNKAARSATTAYAAGHCTLRGLTIRAANVTAPETGIGFADVHADGNLLIDVNFGSTYYHAGESDYSKNLRLERCTFTGSHAYTSSGSCWQWDAGDCGPMSTTVTASAAPISGQRWISVRQSPRSNSDTSACDFDLTHAGVVLTDMLFWDCDFEGRTNATATAIFRADATITTATADDIAWINCRFTVHGITDYGIFASQGGYTTAAGHANRWRVEGCTFNGQALSFIIAGNGSYSSVTQYDRHQGWKLLNNTFNLDVSANSGGQHEALLLQALEEMEVSGNKLVATGTQAGASTLYFLGVANSSGIIARNYWRQDGTITVVYGLVNDCSAAEVAVQAATHPFYRLLMQGNHSKGNINTHFYVPASGAVDGGTNFRVTFKDNVIEGTGTAYNVGNLYRANADTGADGTPINPSTIGATTAGTGAFTSLTDSGLTSGRVTFASTAGLLADDSDFTFATDTLTVTKLSTPTIELGTAATDTTLVRSGAGDATIEGNAIYRAGGTDVPVTDGGTGRSTGTTAYALVATGTTATGAQQTLASGATTELLVGGGASALPVWTTATGSGAPVRATSPALTTPDLGVPSAIDLTNATKFPHLVTFTVDGAGTALTTGVKMPVKIPYGGTLTGYTMTCSPSGSITFNLFRAADGAGLPTASIINSAGGGGGSGTLPAIATGVEGKSTTFTSWGSTTLTAFDNLALNLTTVDGVVTKCTFVLYYR